MDGPFSSYKYLCSMLACVFLLSAIAVRAENKVSGNKASKSVTGLVRDAHTKLPVNAAQITTLNNRSSATTNSSGIF
ncbi:MAG: hypothetical protein PHS84_13535, partial [Paludibacter sp.]|nr:hypothetical protein [Paludibacter sp.]